MGVQRKWEGQLQSNLDFYYKEIKKLKKCFFRFLNYLDLLFFIIISKIIIN